MKIQIYIASVAGIGFIKKGGGTVAAIVFCLIWYVLPATYVSSYWQVIIILLICGIGTWSSSLVDRIWGKDSSKVVIDEVAGMAITLAYVPHNIYFLLTGLLLFRIFDISKPLGIKQLERLPKGWGVMADDVLAGLFSLTLLQLLVYFNCWQ
jgi:phosphatidylglycerophosphatase A